jgi:alpha-beta hydrolase superfamily lysophospholipase
VNPARTELAGEALELGLGDGRVLPGIAWRRQSPRFSVGLVHGLGEHGGRYAALAADLVGAGACVCVADLPGHGRSGGARGDARWSELRDAVVPAILDAARRMVPSAPLVLLGHSMGGLIALDFLLSRPRSVACAVISAVALAPGTPPPGWKVLLAGLVRAVAPGAPFDSGLEDEDRSRDEEVVRLAREDPLVHKRISPRLYFGMAEAQQRVMARAATLALPVLVLQGGADRMVSPAAARTLAQVANPRWLAFREYAGMYHELFNDVGREVVVRDVLGWVGETLREPGA